MCDDRTLKDMNDHLKGELTRRRFGTLSAGVGLAMLLPRIANAQEVTESEVNVPTPDGVADCYFVHPASGQHPGVIIWPDILGLRPAFRSMGKRLAESGYSVLVVNPFYRGKKAPVGAWFRGSGRGLSDWPLPSSGNRRRTRNGVFAP